MSKEIISFIFTFRNVKFTPIHYHHHVIMASPYRYFRLIFFLVVVGPLFLFTDNDVIEYCIQNYKQTIINNDDNNNRKKI